MCHKNSMGNTFLKFILNCLVFSNEFGITVFFKLFTYQQSFHYCQEINIGHYNSSIVYVYIFVLLFYNINCIEQIRTESDNNVSVTAF